MSEAVTASHEVALAPVRGRDRIAVLDMMRGIAILGIFYMNIPFMAGPIAALMGDIRSMGWSTADQHVWQIIEVTWEGTQRGMLEFLFGAGLMVTAAKAMDGDGPVAVADLYIRRNLWLLAFGLLDIFGLLWPGDILHVYALCALGLFPFRKLKVKWLLTLGLAFAAFTAVGGAFQYAGRAETQKTYQVAVEKQSHGQKLNKEEQAAVKEWKDIEIRITGNEPFLNQMRAAEPPARAGNFAAYASFMWNGYLEIVAKGSLLFGVFEAFSAMLIGIALWKLGFLQGKRSTKEYVIALVLAYGFGMGARYIGTLERMTFTPIPKTLWITSELARLAVSFGHVAAINLLARAKPLSRIMDLFRSAGQMAFSLYFMEQIAGIWVMFSPIGMHLPGAQGWAHLAWQATIVVAILLVFANVWMRFFVSGPLEWVWRSLAYNKRQPFLRVKSPALAA